jgi:hypothetical protein
MASKEAREALKQAESDLRVQRRRMSAALVELRQAARAEVMATTARDAAFKAWSDETSADHQAPT